ncbi:MAG: monofunctional biosynthetic peptidoglycan transglycosylase [Acidobacteriota bacterium]
MTWAKAKRLRWLVTRLLMTTVTAVAALGLWVVLSLPDVAALAAENPASTAFIDAARERGENVEWRWTPYTKISLELKKAVVTAEDLSFFSHQGFDTHELKIALHEALRGQRVRGASTITQQLAKNLWLSPSRSPFRKLRELFLTRRLEKHLSKRRILELYLNVAQFGTETYGAEAAAQRYFGVTAADLDADRAAALAAALSRPSSWHPGVTSRSYSRAVARVRARAEKYDWLEKLL